VLPVRQRAEDGAGSLEDVPELGLSEEVFGDTGGTPPQDAPESPPPVAETSEPGGVPQPSAEAPSDETAPEAPTSDEP
jgi:hypothetical protein